MFKFFKSRQKPQKALLVLGTDFGSYQFNEVVEISDEYRIVGFVSDDPWQKKSGFGKTGVFDSSEIKGLCAKEQVEAIILPSDQKDIWLKGYEKTPESEESLLSEKSPLSGLEKLVKNCDILTIQQNLTSAQANQYLADLVNT